MDKKILNEFIKAPDEFSPMPFWFWNDAFSCEEIIKQIQDMHSKGVMGFVIHPRIGIPEEIKYMSDEYLSYVKCAVEEADRLGMQVILYDEAMYPSGSAHGQVVEHNADYASKGIRAEESKCANPELCKGEKLVSSLIIKKDGDKIVSSKKAKDEELPEDWCYLHFIQGYTGGHIRGIHIGEDDWEKPPKSADLLNPEAVKVFISLTHQKYYDALKKYFGNTIIAIFTDEPCIMGREGDLRMKPWTDGFLHILFENGIIEEDLPALWYNIGNKTSIINKKYTEVVQNTLLKSFYKQIYEWCETHKIALAGHPAESDDIGLLKNFHIPGQDLIFRKVAPEDNKSIMGKDSTQAKCSADAARHYGQRRNLNECFACSGKNGIEWSFTADDMKWMMDWLFIRGVNMLVPHAFFYSVDGERRYGERPPDVGPNNIWWKHYKTISDYIKRMSYMMTDSYNVTGIAILCESDYLPYEAAAQFYRNQVEFNYLESRLLEEDITQITDNEIKIANQCYNTLVVERIDMLTDTICNFAKAGGRVIVYNPENVSLNESLICVGALNEITELVNKDVTINPNNPDLRVSHILKGSEHFYVLTNEGENEIEGDISIKSSEEIYLLDAWNGTVQKYEGQEIRLLRRSSLILNAGKNICEEKKLHIGQQSKEDTEIIELQNWHNPEKNIALVLGSWTKISGMSDYCGTVNYVTEFDLSAEDLRSVILDLGTVGEQAEVIVNDQYAGFKLWAPYVLDITSYVRKGKNKLTVSVTNSLANHYTPHRMESGLLDKVCLKITK